MPGISILGEGCVCQGSPCLGLRIVVGSWSHPGSVVECQDEDVVLTDWLPSIRVPCSLDVTGRT